MYVRLRISVLKMINLATMHEMNVSTRFVSQTDRLPESNNCKIELGKFPLPLNGLLLISISEIKCNYWPVACVSLDLCRDQRSCRRKLCLK